MKGMEALEKDPEFKRIVRHYAQLHIDKLQPKLSQAIERAVKGGELVKRTRKLAKKYNVNYKSLWKVIKIEAHSFLTELVFESIEPKCQRKSTH